MSRLLFAGLLTCVLALPANAQISANGQFDTAGVRPIARGNFTSFTASAAACPTMGRSVQQIGAGYVAVFSQGMGSATIDVEGTMDTLSVVVTQDGSHWQAAKVFALPYTGVSASTISAAGQYAIDVAPYQYACVFDPTFSSGPTVTLAASPASFSDIVAGGSGGGGGGGASSAGPPASTTRGTQIACNGGSPPCTINASTFDILNANSSRKACKLTNRYSTTLSCKLTTQASSAASSTSYDFQLFPAASSGAQGGTWNCDSNGAVWQGPVNCTGSGGTTGFQNLEVYEEQ